jgi:signal transduction histidine kinase
VLVNAAEAMESVTDRARILKITLDCKELSDILITVEDSGPGIEVTNIERIFQPFYATKPAGMGMGLAICKSIIEAHEGSMFATPGRWYGLAVHISLPATAIGTAQKVGGGVADGVSASVRPHP